MIVAGTGAGSETDTWPIVLNEVLGTRFKLVTGYVGSQETILAIERGEAHGRCVFSYSALKIAKPDWLRDHKINVLVLTAVEKSPDFPGVPAVVDLVSKPEDRQLLELMVGPGAMARPFVAPPGLPANKATLLRRAFDATMQDPEFRARGDPNPGRSCAQHRRGRAGTGQAHLCDTAAGDRPRQEAAGAVASPAPVACSSAAQNMGKAPISGPPRPGRNPRLGWRAACS